MRPKRATVVHKERADNFLGQVSVGLEIIRRIWVFAWLEESELLSVRATLTRRHFRSFNSRKTFLCSLLCFYIYRDGRRKFIRRHL